MLSIITVTLNAGPTFADCLAAIGAVPVDVEHIVVDGGSTDGTRDHAEQTGARVRLVDGSSIYEAMNEGVRMAQGRHVVFANADDVVLPAGLTSLLASAEEQDAAWAVGSVVVDEGDTQWLLRAPRPRIGPRLTAALGSLPYPHPASVISREFLHRVGPFDEALRYAADYDWAIRALRVEAPLVTRDVVARFRLHGENASSSQRALDESARVTRTHLSSLETVLLPPVAKAVRRVTT